MAITLLLAPGFQTSVMALGRKREKVLRIEDER